MLSLEQFHLNNFFNNEKDGSGKSSMRRLYDCLEVYLCIKVNLINVDVHGGRPLGFMYCIFSFLVKYLVAFLMLDYLYTMENFQAYQY